MTKRHDSSNSDASPLKPGQIVLDSLLVESTIGRGGMAVVYQVRSIETGKRWALKLLTRTDSNTRKRLVREGELQKSLKNNHLIGVKHVLKVNDQPALLMHLAQGPSLQWVLRRKRLTLEESLTVFRGVLIGVGCAHAAGVIHRDLKPANILLHNDERQIVPKVTDFGVAKNLELDDGATQTGTVFGTPAYMAPEQMVESRKVDRRADLWSLGCILYRMTTGKRPFGQKGALLYAAVVQGQFEDPRAINPDLPDNVVFAIREMMCLDVNRRISDCASVMAMLEGKTALMQSSEIGELDVHAPEVHSKAPTTLPLHFIPNRKAPVLDEHRDDAPSGRKVQLGTGTSSSSVISDMPGLNTLQAMKNDLDARLSNPNTRGPESPEQPEMDEEAWPVQPKPSGVPLTTRDAARTPARKTSLFTAAELQIFGAFILGALCFAVSMYLLLW